jgi:hypothetical protein
MDRYVVAARKFIMRMEEEDGHPLEKGTLHVSYVGDWRGYRLYDSYIEGRLVEPRYPPIYVMVDAECDARWMAYEESWEYMKEKDGGLKGHRG